MTDGWYDGVDSDCSGENDYDKMAMGTPPKVLAEMIVMTMTRRCRGNGCMV